MLSRNVGNDANVFSFASSLYLFGMSYTNKLKGSTEKLLGRLGKRNSYSAFTVFCTDDRTVVIETVKCSAEIKNVSCYG